MNEQLQQSAENALGACVKAAGGTGVLSLGTILDYIPDIVGSLSIIIGTIITVSLYRKRNKLLDMAIADREKHRNGDDNE